MFDNHDDNSAQVIQRYIIDHSLKESIKHFTGLDKEKELIQLIYEQYINRQIAEDSQRIELIEKGYEKGFEYEKVYKGCAQCTLLAMFEIIGEEKPELFKAASGLSGDMALCGDGSCGGYTGGIMLLGSLIGRRMDYLDKGGDKKRRDTG